MALKSLTLRLPIEIYAEVAARKRRTVTEFIVDAVNEKLARERTEELRRGFATLAGSVDEEEMRLWSAAQAKAMEHIDA